MFTDQGKKKVYSQNIQLLEHYGKVSKDQQADASSFRQFKDGKYKHIADTAKLQTETRNKRLTESPNSSKNTYDVMWDNAKVGDELKLIGHGKHRRDVHLGKKITEMNLGTGLRLLKDVKKKARRTCVRALKS